MAWRRVLDPLTCDGTSYPVGALVDVRPALLPALEQAAVIDTVDLPAPGLPSGAAAADPAETTDPAADRLDPRGARVRHRR